MSGSDLRVVSLADFHYELKGQGVATRDDYAFRCPICGTVQSSRSLIAARAGNSFDEVEGYIAFSCVGRWTGAGSHKLGTAPGRGCDWTLGGLFSLHRLAVDDGTGELRPCFEPASPEEAQRLAAWFAENPTVRLVPPPAEVQAP